MILVTLGTQDKDFSRLLKVIDKEIEEKRIKEKVIVQAGMTKYESKNMEIFDLINPDELEKLVKKCNILITHGGVGSILSGVQNGKKIIAAARLKKYREHTNDHQKQIIKEFASRGYLLELRDFNQLGKLLEKVKTFKPTKFVSNNQRFIQLVDNYIQKDHHTSWYNQYRRLLSFGYDGMVLTLWNTFMFALLYGKVNFYLNIMISFVITMLLNFLFHIVMKVRIKKKIGKYALMKVGSLLLDLSFMHILVKMVNINSIHAKFISALLIMILSLLVIKCCFREDDV